MIAAYAFLLGAFAGYLEGNSYLLTAGGPSREKPSGWKVILALLALPALATILLQGIKKLLVDHGYTRLDW